ncbi:MAG: hypothetical protein ISR39_10285 [Akkermansiaceae bacterium]|nr:hypothetical protein [Akkermansiaceae bacterium]
MRTHSHFQHRMLSPQQTLDTYYLEARCDLLEQLGFTPSPQNDLMPNINKTGIMPIKVREEGWAIIEGNGSFTLQPLSLNKPI